MTLLTVEHLVKRFGSMEAVKGISFGIEEGRCVTLLGPNGAGKTTTLKMLAGLIAPTSGKVVMARSADGDIRSLIGYLPQYPAFYNWMTGREFLIYVGRLAHIEKHELKRRTDDILERVGLSDARNRKIGGYSGGMKQRLGLAQALIHRPKLLILDEPVSALDPLGRREVLELLKQIRQETTILFSTHVLHDAEEISDDVLIMNHGEIVAAGSLAALIDANRKPLIVLESDQPLDQWMVALKGNAYITDITTHVNKAEIVVNDIEQAKQAVLQEIVDNNIPIRKFELATTSLEDYFMKVVKA